MSRFRPTRASSPAKSSTDIGSSSFAATTFSRSSIVSVPELQGLTESEVEILDAVVERAGASASTFFTVFKAHNDVLKERGLDHHEVVYYGRLLKLGTLKGRNWLEKWQRVKAQYGYDKRKEDESFSSHTENVEPVPQYHLTPRILASTPPTLSILAGNSLGLEFDDSESYDLLRRPQHRVWDAETITSTPPSYRTTPREPLPTHTPIQQPALRPASRIFRPSPSIPSNAPDVVAAHHQTVAQARERPSSVINAEKTWKNLKMVKDEEDAARFHDDRLVERCWQVWSQGVQWTLETNEQIDHARDNLLLRTVLERWKAKAGSRHELYTRITTLSNNRLLKSVLRTWKLKTKQRKQLAWRASMREKMKTIRERRQVSITSDAWERWQNALRGKIADRKYVVSVRQKAFVMWKDKLGAVDQLESVADEFIRNVDDRQLIRLWRLWISELQLRNAERIVQERTGLRVMGEVMDIWVKRVRDNQHADALYDRSLLKRSTHSWLTTVVRVRALETRALKFVSRQDDVLVRAFIRIWKARERGRLLERVMASRLMSRVWQTWQLARDKRQMLEASAISFSNRPKVPILTSSLLKWHHAYTTHQRSNAYAQQYYNQQLSYSMLLKWRIRLRNMYAVSKRARTAEKVFILRRIFGVWKEKVEEKKREQKHRMLQRRRVQRIFNVWLEKARHERTWRLAEQAVERRLTARITKTALHRWINRVIVLKDRELDALPMHGNLLVAAAFNKWKAVCLRHVEELNLMESYQFVKKEETQRKMFYRWLSAARASRRRRLVLQGKEDEIRLMTLSVAWDKWRDRFKDEKLRYVEYATVMQNQKNLLYKAFGAWRSKTKSLPAIGFYASHKKAQAWAIWRGAMPRALQARKARLAERKLVLGKHFERWLQAYRTKIALKAVARARYLRLPTAAPRKIAPLVPRTFPRPQARAESSKTGSRKAESKKADSESESEAQSLVAAARAPIPASRFTARTSIASLMVPRARSSKTGSRKAESKKAVSESESEASLVVAARAPIPASRFTARTSIANLMVPRARSEVGGTTRLSREVSPTRSSIVSAPKPSSASATGDVGRSKLWLELRDIRRKSQTPSEAL